MFFKKYILTWPVITGLITLIIALLITQFWKEEGPWKKFCLDCCFTILTSCSVGYVFTLISKNDISDNAVKAIQSNLDKNRNFTKFGISKIFDSPTPFKENFDDLIKESKRLYVVVNDGKHWITEHAESLKKRLKDSDKETFVFFPDLSIDSLNEVLLRKTNHLEDPMYIKNKINLSYKNLKSFLKNGHKLKFFLQPNFTSYSFYMADKTAIISPYNLSSQKGKFPYYIFFKPTDAICEDCDSCRIPDDQKNHYCDMFLDVSSLIHDSRAVNINEEHLF